jgi:hypothetical protein
VLPPGGKGTTMRMGFDGNVCPLTVIVVTNKKRIADTKIQADRYKPFV